MDGIGQVAMIHKNMRVQIIALPHTCPDHLDGMVGICESWNQRRGLWNVRLPSGEIECMHPLRLGQYIDEARKPPARQHQAQREDVPRAPPKNLVVLNCDSVGFVFTQSATRAHTGQHKFSWDGVRRAFDYYAAQGLRVLVAVKQGHLEDWKIPGCPGTYAQDPLRRALTPAPVDDRIGAELVVGCWTLQLASSQNRGQAIDNAKKAEWQRRADSRERALLAQTSEDFMRRVAEHVVTFQFDADGKFTPARALEV